MSPKKVGQVLWHPTAANVLATASGEHLVKLWDLADPSRSRSTLNGHADTIQSLAFNGIGTVLATTCRDKKLRLFDPRTGADPVRVTEGHGGIKGARVVWMGEHDRIATTGFSKMSDRQVSIWETGGLGNVKTLTIDQSAGVVMPFWSDNGILFLGMPASFLASVVFADGSYDSWQGVCLSFVLNVVCSDSLSVRTEMETSGIMSTSPTRCTPSRSTRPRTLSVACASFLDVRSKYPNARSPEHSRLPALEWSRSRLSFLAG